MALHSASAKRPSIVRSGDFALKSRSASISSTREMCKPMSGDFIAIYTLGVCSSTVVLKTPLDRGGRMAASTEPLWTAGLFAAPLSLLIGAKLDFLERGPEIIYFDDEKRVVHCRTQL